jgi:PAS domain S-box-containing protein
MNWIDLAWPMMSAASMVLALIHSLIWFKQRDQKAHLAFALIGLSVACIAIQELLAMHATTPEDYAAILRWGHVAFAAMVIGIVCFIRLNFKAGNMALAVAVCVIRLLALIPNFFAGDNLHFRKITSLYPVDWGGVMIATPVGIANPWLWLGQLSLVLLFVFLIDAIATVWRRGDRRERLRVLLVCGSMLIFMTCAAALAIAVIRYGVHAPISINPAFMPVLLAMSYVLSGDILRAAQLARNLELSESNLEQSEQRAELRFQLVVEAAPTAMLMAAADGRIALVNQQAERVFGYARSELLTMTVEQLVPTSMRAAHVELRTGYTAQATARTMGAGRELFGQRKDGSLVPVEIALNPIHTDEGLFVLASIGDISERKRMERESAMQRDELAHLSRVALLAELSGSLAHELNQPLTAILSNAQAAVRFMAHTPPNLDEVSESLANIVENDKRAGEVIRRLRAMLRKDPADYRRLDVNEVVMDVLRIIRSDLLNRNIELALQLAPNLPAVGGDRVQLQQVLLNLVMNGSEAMSEFSEGRQLTIRTQSTFVGVEVSVADVGSGIPAEDLERIFSPFVTSKSDGMGLGLAVCTTIIQTHGGKLWASNNIQRGATVHFSLPITELT